MTAVGIQPELPVQVLYVSMVERTAPAAPAARAIDILMQYFEQNALTTADDINQLSIINRLVSYTGICTLFEFLTVLKYHYYGA